MMFSSSFVIQYRFMYSAGVGKKGENGGLCVIWGDLLYLIGDLTSMHLYTFYADMDTICTLYTLI